MRTIPSLAEGSETVGRVGFRPGQRLRQLVAPAAPLPQPSPLLVDDPALVEPWLVGMHAAGHTQAGRDISCHYLTDLVVSGPGHLHVGDALVVSDEVMPDYWRRQVLERFDPYIDIDIARERRLPERRIDGATLVCCGWGVGVYGHFLIETLPRLLVARAAAGHDLLRMQLLLPANAPAWLVPMLRAVTPLPTEMLRVYDPARERVRLANAVIPTLASVNGWFHPWFGDAVEGLVAAARRAMPAPPARRLFVTRAGVAGGASPHRRCRNETRLAAIAASEFGFTAIAPETMPWTAQIASFAAADVVIGPFGSGLHNALFSGPGTRVGSIGFMNLTQSMIGALRRHRNAYLHTASPDGADYDVDEAAFRAFLSAMLR